MNKDKIKELKKGLSDPFLFDRQTIEHNLRIVEEVFKK